jgi:hypothetical protein
MWWKSKRSERDYLPRYRFKIEEEGAISAGWWREHRPCKVRDVSSGGAGVELEFEEPLPRIMTLFLPAERMSARVRKVWQKGRRVGFQFLDE